TLERNLDAAMPAEKPFSVTDMDPQSATPALDRNQIDPEDGVWVCCCKNENRITHFQGAFPFKHLTCGKCNKVPCRLCLATEILTPFLSDTADCSDQDDRELRFCQICPGCGLSHRTESCNGRIVFSKNACLCGQSQDESWLRYQLGSVAAYRADATRIAQELLLKLSSDAMWRRFD
ncbi:hypothetical protein P153DRAFT_272174, partial [Dothidotthia symphoricarpi CBS 119687]